MSVTNHSEREQPSAVWCFGSQAYRGKGKSDTPLGQKFEWSMEELLSCVGDSGPQIPELEQNGGKQVPAAGSLYRPVVMRVSGCTTRAIECLLFGNGIKAKAKSSDSASKSIVLALVCTPHGYNRLQVHTLRSAPLALVKLLL